MKRLFIIGAGASIDHSNKILPGTQNFLIKAREASGLDFYKDLDEEELTTGEPLSDQSETTQRYLASLYGIWVSAFRKTYWGIGWNEKKDQEYKNSQLLERLKDINIEELLTLVVISRQIDPSLPSEDHIINLIVETINYYSQKVDPEKGTYTDFVEQLDPKSDSIITFNWDILLDQIFSENYAPPYRTETGVVGYYSNFLKVCTAERDHSNEIREPSWAKLETIKPYIPDSTWEQSEPTIPFGSHYIKLHGSIDLVYCTNNLCENYQKPLIRKGQFPKENKCGACHEAVKLYLIPPIQNKPIRDMPYIRRSWNKAQELCATADQVVFWGYSLPQTDYWSNWLVKQIWAGRCEEIIVINPECEKDESFVNRFCPTKKFRNKQINKNEFKDFRTFLKSQKDKKI